MFIVENFTNTTFFVDKFSIFLKNNQIYLPFSFEMPVNEFPTLFFAVSDQDRTEVPWKTSGKSAV